MMLGRKVTGHEFDKSVPSGAHEAIEAVYPVGLYFPGTQSYAYEGMGYLGHLGFDGVMRWAATDIKFTLAQDMTDLAEAESLLNIAEDGFADLQALMSQQMFDHISALLDKANDEEAPAIKRQLAHEVYNLLKAIENGDEPPPSGGASDKLNVAEFVITEAEAADASPERQAYLDAAVEALDDAREAYLDGFLDMDFTSDSSADDEEAWERFVAEYGPQDDDDDAFIDSAFAVAEALSPSTNQDMTARLKRAVTCEGTSQEVAHKLAAALYASGDWNGLEQLLITDDPGRSEPREGRHYEFPSRQTRYILRYKQGNQWFQVCYPWDTAAMRRGKWSGGEAVLFENLDEARRYAQSYTYDSGLEGDIEFECRRYNGEDRQRFTILSGPVLKPADETPDDETLGKGGKVTLGALNRQTVELKERVAELTAERDELAAVLDEMEADVNDLLARKGRAYKADPLLADASIVQQLEAELDFIKTSPVEVRTLVQLLSWDPRQSVTFQTSKADDDLAVHLNDGWTIINMTINTVAGNDGTRHYRYVTLQRPAQPQPAPVAPMPDDGETKTAVTAVSPEGENSTLANAQGEKSPLPDLLADKPIGRAIREHGLNAVTEAMNAHVVGAARRAYEADDDDQPMPTTLALAEVN